MTGHSPSAATKTVDLRSVSPPRLFFALLHQRFTGTLGLDQQGSHPGQRTVWFEGGMPVFTNWVEPSEVLGQVLVGIRTIDESQLNQALERMAKHPDLLGETLMKMGALDAGQLRTGLMRQCARKLTRLFAYRDGMLTVSAHHHDLDGLERVNALELILNGVLRHFDVARITEEVGTALTGPIQATSALTRYHAHFRFRGEDLPIVEELQRGTTLEALVRAGFKPLRAAQHVYVLWACQMLRTEGVVLDRAEVTSSASRSGPLPSASHSGSLPTSSSASHSGPFPSPSSASRSGPLPTPHSGPSSASRSGPLPTPHSGPSSASRSGPLPSSQSSSASRAGPLPSSASHSSSASRSGPLPSSASHSGPFPSPGALDSNEAFEERLAGLEAKIRRRAHAFDLLGVPLEADRRQIRAAWSDLSRHVHPDVLAARQLGHLRERVGAVFAALSEAHATLTDRAQREALQRRISRGEDPTGDQNAAAVAHAAIESEMIARNAERFLNANHFERALERYQAALALNPAEPDWRAAAAWCAYCLSPRQRADMTTAELILTAICNEFPKQPRSHYFRGLVLRDMGDTHAALAALDRASLLDPRMIDAERQARAIRMQAQNATGKGSSDKRGRGLMGFFKR